MSRVCFGFKFGEGGGDGATRGGDEGRRGVFRGRDVREGELLKISRLWTNLFVRVLQEVAKSRVIIYKN